jgi:O-6-methylguanine DNA methyltransferase
MATTWQLHQSIYQSPIGEILIMANQKSIFLVDFSHGKHLKKHLTELKNAYGTIKNEANELCRICQKQLEEYFAGQRQVFDLALAFSGTSFQQKVWHSLEKIPYGQCISYAMQANNIEKPKAIRAVASANGQNKIAIIVPCHRVIGKNGKLTGYASGVENKAFLLALEEGLS